MPLSILQILQNLQIPSLNEMQEKAVEAGKTDQDMVLVSPTGSGKTLAFLLPVYQRLDLKIKTVQALIIVPTRELALQVTSVIQSMKIPFKVTCCYGGHPLRLEQKSLQTPPAILVATPGRMADHIRRNHIDISTVSMLILDEFDKSLAFGFHREVTFIIDQLVAVEKRMLTSATKSLQIPHFVGLQNPISLQFEAETEQPQLSLKRVQSPEKDKLNTLFQLICELKGESMLIFCNFRQTVERVSAFLEEKGIIHDFFHGGLEQIEREKKLVKFRNGTYQILVSTDVTARGLDIPEIQYIIHYHLPTKEDIFIHRNGRTARMHATGTVFLLQYVKDKLPYYLQENPPIFPLQEESLPPKPAWRTLHFNKGKKNRVSKGDIVGFLIKIGGLEKTDIGLIEVKHFFAYVAIKRNKINDLLKNIRGKKIKGKAIRVSIDD